MRYWRHKYVMQGCLWDCLGCSERLRHTLRQQGVDVYAAVDLRLKQLLLKCVALQEQGGELIGLLQHAVLHHDARAQILTELPQLLGRGRGGGGGGVSCSTNKRAIAACTTNEPLHQDPLLAELCTGA